MPPAGCNEKPGPATVRTSQQACSGQYLPTELAVSGASRPTTRTAAPRLRSTSVSAASPSTVSKVHGTRRCRCKARRATPNIATSISVRSSALRPAGKTWTKRTRDPRCTASRTAAPATRVAIPSLTRPATTSGWKLDDCVPAGLGVVDVCMKLIVVPASLKRQSRKSLYYIDLRLDMTEPSSVPRLLHVANVGITHGWHCLQLALPIATNRENADDAMVTTLTFLGAAGTVTGSKFLLEHEGRKTLVDCGLYQGERTWRRLNWQPLPVSANLISDVVLTHAHLDHCGHLPALVREGFTGPTWCTQGTAALAAIVLRDSAYLQEEDAENARLWGFSRHDPPRPLYNAADAEKAITSFRALNYHQHCALHSGAHLSFSRAGHILGSACALITIGASTVLFSGDLVEPATRCSSPGRHRLAPAPSSSSRPTAPGLPQSMASPTTRSWLSPVAVGR